MKKLDYIITVKNEEMWKDFDIFFDKEFNDYQVRSQSGTTLFRAETEALARYGIRTYHNNDWCGMKLYENNAV